MAAAALERKYLRPAMIIFSDTEPIQDAQDLTKWELGQEYLYLSDDGRDSVAAKPERIESRQRMANGRMRSYHVADKFSFSTSWENLPSRPLGPSDNALTSDAFASGQEIKDWYESHTGSFWMLLVYDAETSDLDISNQVEKYNVFFEDFSFDVVKRGMYNDLWNVSISLVEA